MTQSLTPDAPLGDSATAKGSLRLRWWFITIPLFITVMIWNIDRVCISVVIANKQFLKDMNLIGRPAVTGLLMSGFLFSYAICHFPWGYFVKRFGPRLAAIISVLMWGGSLTLSGAAQSIGALITARVILGIGEAAMYILAAALIANWFPVKERARANSIYINGVNIGQVLAGALVVALIMAGGWRMVFYSLAAVSIVIPLPLIIFLMRDRPRQQKLISPAEATLIEEGSLAKTKDMPKTRGKENYLKNYRFWLVTVAWGAQGMYFYGWGTWLPTYFHTVRHFSFQAAGYLYSLSNLFVALAIFAVAYFSDRTMRRAPFATVGPMIACVLTYVGGNLIVNAYWALAVLILAVCCVQPAFTMFMSLLQSIVPEKSMGAATGVAGGVAGLISMISPVLAGFLLQVSGFGAVMIFFSLAAFTVGALNLILTAEGY